jgi:hypothetical protein
MHQVWVSGVNVDVANGVLGLGVVLAAVGAREASVDPSVKLTDTSVKEDFEDWEPSVEEHSVHDDVTNVLEPARLEVCVRRFQRRPR